MGGAGQQHVTGFHFPPSLRGDTALQPLAQGAAGPGLESPLGLPFGMQDPEMSGARAE